MRYGIGKGIVLAAVAAMSIASASIARAAEGNPDDGEEVFKKCRACHKTDKGANLVGPSLNGIVGRKAGTVEGFKYSPANLDAGSKGLVWTEEVLNKYLENPLKFVPGTTMAFAGLKDEQDRLDVIAYLKKFK